MAYYWKAVGRGSPISEGMCVTTYFITRHQGAANWARQEGIAFEQLLDHLDPTKISCGDVVIGSLPVNLAAEVCQLGGRYFHLDMQLPRHLRGIELSAEQIREVGARIQEYRIEPVFSE